MGVSTGWGGGARLVGIVGRRAALRLLAWSKPVTADEGLALGLVDAVAAEEGGALTEARGFLGGVLKHDARGQLVLMFCVGVCRDRAGFRRCSARSTAWVLLPPYSIHSKWCAVDASAVSELFIPLSFVWVSKPTEIAGLSSPRAARTFSVREIDEISGLCRTLLFP